MRLLSVVHGEEVRGEVFDDVVRGDGHELDEWWIVERDEPPRPLSDYDAVLVFGGAMNVDQEDEHPWLRREDEFVRGLLEQRMPTLGVCLGGQLLAKAAGAHVGRSPEPEAGFVPVTRTDDAARDPIFGALTLVFDVFEAHQYAFQVPVGAVELARSRVCSQAFRVGDSAWGIQFHPEIRLEQVATWLRNDPAFPNGEAIVAELRDRIEEWQSFGAALCRAFLAAAGRERSLAAQRI